MIKRFSAVQIAMLLTGSIFFIGAVTIIVVSNNNNADDPSTGPLSEAILRQRVPTLITRNITRITRGNRSPVQPDGRIGVRRIW